MFVLVSLTCVGMFVATYLAFKLLHIAQKIPYVTLCTLLAINYQYTFYLFLISNQIKKTLLFLILTDLYLFYFSISFAVYMFYFGWFYLIYRTVYMFVLQSTFYNWSSCHLFQLFILSFLIICFYVSHNFFNRFLKFFQFLLFIKFFFLLIFMI